jgi:hypothetical protein
MKLLSPAHVAEALGIKPQSLRLRRMKGQGPPFIRLSDSPTGRAYYRESEFNAWLAARPSRMGTAEEKQAALPCASAPLHAPTVPESVGEGSGATSTTSRAF